MNTNESIRRCKAILNDGPLMEFFNPAQKEALETLIQVAIESQRRARHYESQIKRR